MPLVNMATTETNILGANTHIMRTPILTREIGLDGSKDAWGMLFTSGKTLIKGRGQVWRT